MFLCGYTKLSHIRVVRSQRACQRELCGVGDRCYLKLGDWQEYYGIDENSIPQVIHYYELATKHDKQW